MVLSGFSQLQALQITVSIVAKLSYLAIQQARKYR